MKLSVVVSTFNGEKYIYDQLESIYGQTREPDEVLIFDDCSSDRTVDIINEYIRDKHLDNWRCIRNTQNKGWKRNFMEAMWAASGDIILPCDQDDIWMNDKLCEIDRIFEKKQEILLLVTNCISFYPDGKEIIRPHKENLIINKEKPHPDFFEVKYPGCTYAVRKSLVEMSRLYWEDNFPHDALLWRMALYLDGAYSYNKSLIRRRKHRDSAYTMESVKLKSFEVKRKWFDYANRALKSTERLINENHVHHKEEKKNIIEMNSKAIDARIRFYDSPSFLNGLALLKYYQHYPRKRQLIGDWYLVLLKRNK